MDNYKFRPNSSFTIKVQQTRTGIIRNKKRNFSNKSRLSLWKIAITTTEAGSYRISIEWDVIHFYGLYFHECPFYRIKRWIVTYHSSFDFALQLCRNVRVPSNAIASISILRYKILHIGDAYKAMNSRI